MSDLFVALVSNLRPLSTYPRSPITTPTAASRAKFVLLLMASRAEETGHCQVSIGQLMILMESRKPELIRASLRDLEQQRLITRLAEPGRYRLQRRELERNQTDTKDSVQNLVDYGVNPRHLNILNKIFHDKASITKLGKLIRKYRSLPTGEQRGFHHFISEVTFVKHSFGKGMADKILEVYTQWESTHPRQPK